jgi:peptide/nickel transport system ATP-binding protein
MIIISTDNCLQVKPFGDLISVNIETGITSQWRNTQMLESAIPDITMSGKARTPVAEEVPNPLDPPPGCAFNPRCPHANDRCRAERPELRDHEGAQVACHAVEEQRIALARI